MRGAHSGWTATLHRLQASVLVRSHLVGLTHVSSYHGSAAGHASSILVSGIGDQDAKREKWNKSTVSEPRVCEAGSETLFWQSAVTDVTVTVIIQGSTIPGATV